MISLKKLTLEEAGKFIWAQLVRLGKWSTKAAYELVWQPKPEPLWHVYMDHPGDKKVEVIKAVRQWTGQGLREAKGWVDHELSLPLLPAHEAEVLCKLLVDQGAFVSRLEDGADISEIIIHRPPEFATIGDLVKAQMESEGITTKQVRFDTESDSFVDIDTCPVGGNDDVRLWPDGDAKDLDDDAFESLVEDTLVELEEEQVDFAQEVANQLNPPEEDVAEGATGSRH